MASAETPLNQESGRWAWSTLALIALPPLFWAGNFIVGRAVRGDIPPMTLSFSRWVIASLLLLPFSWRFLWRDRALYRAHFPLIFAVSVSGVTAFNSLVYLGLQSTAATNGIILNSFIPLLIVLLGALFFGFTVQRRQVVGMLVSFAGVLTIVLRGEWERLATLNVAHGDLIILLAMVCWALYTIWIKKMPVAINRVGLLQVQMALGLLCLMPFFLWEYATQAPAVWHRDSFLAVAYVGIFPSVLAFLLYNACVGRLGPERAGLSIHLMPLFGAVLSVALLGEALHGYHLLGALLIFSGIALAGRKR